MRQEDLQKTLEAFSKGEINVAGDFVVNKHVEYEVANVEAGGIGIQIVNGSQQEGKTENSSDDDVLNLLDELVKDAIKNRNTPKYILLPVRAAKDAEVLPCVDLKWVNERYNLKLNPMNWSTWVNQEDVGYDGRELLPLVSRFQALKTPK